MIPESLEHASDPQPNQFVASLDKPMSSVLVVTPDQHHGAARDPLIEAARYGDRKALSELLNKHDAQIRRICRRLSRDIDEMYDILQETMLAIVQHIGGFRGESSFSTWVYTLARTCRTRRFRKKGQYRHFEHSFDEHSEIIGIGVDLYKSIEEQLDHTKLEQAYHRALARLSQLDREVLILRDIEGASTRETAQSLALTVPAAKTRLHRARQLVRRRLTDP